MKNNNDNSLVCGCGGVDLSVAMLRPTDCVSGVAWGTSSLSQLNTRIVVASRNGLHF